MSPVAELDPPKARTQSPSNAERSATPALGVPPPTKPADSGLGFVFAYTERQKINTAEAATAPVATATTDPVAALHQLNDSFQKRYDKIDKGFVATICNWFSSDQHTAAQKALDEFQTEYKHDTQQELLHNPAAQKRLEQKAQALEKALETMEGRKAFTGTAVKIVGVTAATIAATALAAPLVTGALAAAGVATALTGLGVSAGLGVGMSTGLAAAVTGGLGTILTAGTASFVSRMGLGYVLNGFKYSGDQAAKDAKLAALDGVCMGGASILANAGVTGLFSLFAPTIKASVMSNILGRVVVGAAEGAVAGSIGMGSETAAITASDPRTWQPGKGALRTIISESLHSVREGAIGGAIGGAIFGVFRGAPKQEAAATSDGSADEAATAAAKPSKQVAASDIAQAKAAEPVPETAPSSAAEQENASAVTHARSEALKKMAELSVVDEPTAQQLKAKAAHLDDVAKFLDDTTPAEPRAERDFVDRLFDEVAPSEGSTPSSAQENASHLAAQTTPVQAAKPASSNLHEDLARMLEEQLSDEETYGSLVRDGALPEVQKRMERLDLRIAEARSQLKLAQNPNANARTIENISEATAGGLNGPPSSEQSPPPTELSADASKASELTDEQMRAIWDGSTEAGQKMGSQAKVLEAKKPVQDDWFKALVDDSKKFAATETKARGLAPKTPELDAAQTVSEVGQARPVPTSETAPADKEAFADWISRRADEVFFGAEEAGETNPLGRANSSSPAERLSKLNEDLLAVNDELSNGSGGGDKIEALAKLRKSLVGEIEHLKEYNLLDTPEIKPTTPESGKVINNARSANLAPTQNKFKSDDRMLEELFADVDLSSGSDPGTRNSPIKPDTRPDPGILPRTESPTSSSTQQPRGTTQAEPKGNDSSIATLEEEATSTATLTDDAKWADVGNEIDKISTSPDPQKANSGLAKPTDTRPDPGILPRTESPSSRSTQQPRGTTQAEPKGNDSAVATLEEEATSTATHTDDAKWSDVGNEIDKLTTPPDQIKAKTEITEPTEDDFSPSEFDLPAEEPPAIEPLPEIDQRGGGGELTQKENNSDFDRDYGSGASPDPQEPIPQLQRASAPKPERKVEVAVAERTEADDTHDKYIAELKKLAEELKAKPEPKADEEDWASFEDLIKDIPVAEPVRTVKTAVPTPALEPITAPPAEPETAPQLQPAPAPAPQTAPAPQVAPAPAPAVEPIGSPIMPARFPQHAAMVEAIAQSLAKINPALAVEVAPAIAANISAEPQPATQPQPALKPATATATETLVEDPIKTRRIGSLDINSDPASSDITRYRGGWHVPAEKVRSPVSHGKFKGKGRLRVVFHGDKAKVEDKTSLTPKEELTAFSDTGVEDVNEDELQK